MSKGALQWSTPNTIVVSFGAHGMHELNNRLPTDGTRQEIFLPTQASRWILWPTQPRNKCGQGALSPWVKWPRRETNNSSPSGFELKHVWSCTWTIIITKNCDFQIMRRFNMRISPAFCYFLTRRAI